MKIVVTKSLRALSLLAVCLWQLASDDFMAILISRVCSRTKLQAYEHIGGNQKPGFGNWGDNDNSKQENVSVARPSSGYEPTNKKRKNSKSWDFTN